MTQPREQRREELEKLAKATGGHGKLSAVYLNSLQNKPARAGLSPPELIEEILRLEFDEAERL